MLVTTKYEDCWCASGSELALEAAQYGRSGFATLFPLCNRKQRLFGCLIHLGRIVMQSQNDIPRALLHSVQTEAIVHFEFNNRFFLSTNQSTAIVGH